MADTTQAPVNGTYIAPPTNPYADAYLAHATMSNAGASYHPAPSSTANGPVPENKNEISKDEVGWYFVEQYYTTMSRSPEKLNLFYSRRSQLVCGNEAESVPVIVGQKAINDKIKELDFHDCKVRVLNVDSQASFDNILVAVIGEISNRSEPSRKFTQTFVLAQQPNGYYVLNDIFRYLADDDEEFVPSNESVAEPEVADAPETAAVTKGDTATESTEPVTLADDEQAAAKADAKLEAVAANGEAETVEEPEAPTQVNGEAVHEKAAVPVTPAVPVVPAEAETLKPEKPETPESTPADSPAPKEAAPVAKQEAAPAKAVPKTWATIASNNRASAAAAAAAAAAAGTPAAAPAAPQPKATATATSSQQAQPQQEQAVAAAPTEAVATSSQAASTDGAGWQTAGHDHSKKQSRTDDKYSAYIKNVTDKVDAALLRTVLSRYGKLVHFDVNRQRNCAFVDFADQAAYNAAVAANPHQIGSEQVTVEERRVRAGNFGSGFPAGRGSGSGANRGRSDGRAGSQGRGGSGFQRDQGRGGFAPRGRGGSNVNSNKGRSQAQAA